MNDFDKRSDRYAAREDEIFFMTLVELSSCLESGSLTSVKILSSVFERIHRLEPDLGAFVSLLEEQAMEAARASDRLRLSGRKTSPLMGVPFALKDNFDLEGATTTVGVPLWKTRIATETCVAAQKLITAGMIPVGKNSMVPLAYGSWGTNEAAGTPWNPWNMREHYIPGGSSSGSAVAVAAGLVPVSLGSDSGGSIRIPAALCGVTGLKPTFGSISSHGCFPLSPTFDSTGPVARSVEDVALLFQYLRKTPEEGGGSAGSVLANLKAGITGFRIACPQPRDLEIPSPEMERAFSHTLDVLKKCGAKIIPATFPAEFSPYQESSAIIMAAEAYAGLGDLVEDPHSEFDLNVARRVLSGKYLPASTYLHALEEQKKARESFAKFFEHFDVIVTPATPGPAIPLREVNETIASMGHYVRATNYLGLCALVVPCGFSSEGLPLAFQIIGKPGAEATILRLGQAWQENTDWHLRHPAL